MNRILLIQERISNKPLKGVTIVVTGGSRGIGLEIAKKCAADGANIAILAKTAENNPKLPGTQPFMKGLFTLLLNKLKKQVEKLYQ